MANIYKGTLGLIGNTPLVEVTNVEKDQDLNAKILDKIRILQSGRKCQGQNCKSNDRGR